MDLLINIFASVLIAATPLVLASLGELVAERSGVLNLGVEGMMVIGAIAGFAATLATGSTMLGFMSAILAGAAMAAIFAVLTQIFLSNQVATGLALTLFGLGLSALIGQGYSGKSLPRFPRLDGSPLDAVPVLGRLLAALDVVLVASIGLVFAVSWVLYRTRSGLILRAVGENHDAAHAIGYPVIAVRFMALMFGGACAGLAGAYLSVVQSPLWAERMTAGRGWIALALVVFAAWRPARVLAGACLFGGITIIQFHGQAQGLKIDAQILAMLPYLATILVLVLISRDTTRARLNAPACLGKPFYASA